MINSAHNNSRLRMEKCRLWHNRSTFDTYRILLNGGSPSVAFNGCKLLT